MKKLYISLLLLLISGCTFSSKVFNGNNEIQEIKNLSYEEIVTTMDDGIKLTSYLYKPDGIPRASIFLFQGNGGNPTFYSDNIRPLVKAGYQIFLFGYRGYGKSKGKPDFEIVLNDAKKIFNDYLNMECTKNQIIIVMGYSLGGNFAINLTAACQEKIDALITEGTFTTLNSIAQHFSSCLIKPFAFLFVKSPYDMREVIKEIRIPKFIIHSNEDKVVPFEMGKEIFESANEPKTFYETRGSHIRTIKEYPVEYLEHFNSFIEAVNSR